MNNQPKPGGRPNRRGVLGLLLILATASIAQAHVGRRFTVEVVDGKLQAQGINTGDSDGAPIVRPYLNVIHDHWKNVDGLDVAYATLPGYDVSPSAATALLGGDLTLEFTGVSRWQSPPLMPSDLTKPVLTPLAPGEVITVEGAGGVVDSLSFGSFTLLAGVPFGGVKDVDPRYEINQRPAGEIQVLQFVLSSSLTTVEPSDPIFVLLSPDGDNAQTKLHHASLFLENYIASVPEPTMACLAALALLAGWPSSRCGAR